MSISTDIKKDELLLPSTGVDSPTQSDYDDALDPGEVTKKKKKKTEKGKKTKQSSSQSKTPTPPSLKTPSPQTPSKSPSPGAAKLKNKSKLTIETPILDPETDEVLLQAQAKLESDLAEYGDVRQILATMQAILLAIAAITFVSIVIYAVYYIRLIKKIYDEKDLVVE